LAAPRASVVFTASLCGNKCRRHINNIRRLPSRLRSLRSKTRNRLYAQGAAGRHAGNIPSKSNTVRVPPCSHAAAQGSLPARALPS
jgi:hypothetical protein